MSIFVAVEDRLSGAVARRLINDVRGHDVEVRELGSSYRGNSNLRGNLSKYMELASRETVFLLTDLDQTECAPTLRTNWFGRNATNNNLAKDFIFCIAVREVEAWLLADKENFAQFLGIYANQIENSVEVNIADPKAYLVQLARRARNRDVKADLVPAPRSGAKVGIGYNERLAGYVRDVWMPLAAARTSESLRRAIERLSVR